MDKSLLTNLVAAALVGVALVSPESVQSLLLPIGLFALSGAITNWLAVHMLFERVPGLYGSGVVVLHFEEFKQGIHQLIMEQFFTEENIQKFFQGMQSQEGAKGLDFTPVIENTDLNPAFDRLLEVIMNSSFGSMLSMFGGVEAVEPLREPFIEKMRLALGEISESESFVDGVEKALEESTHNHDMLTNISHIVAGRLDELTPQMVKEIVQTMIKKHLGWLVVWGGVFGGFIGLVMGLLQ